MLVQRAADEFRRPLPLKFHPVAFWPYISDGGIPNAAHLLGVPDPAVRKKRTVRFHFVRQKDGRPALIYAKGNGKEYRMRK